MPTANQFEKVTIMRSTITPKTIRRLVAADGYLALNMPERAIEELHKVSDAGVLEGPRQLLLGIAQKTVGAPEDAIPHLELAARTMPKSARQFAWSELASCYRAVGSSRMADLAESLGGDREYELQIALPHTNLTITSTESAAELI